MDVFDLTAKITLDSSGYESGLDNAGKKTGMFGSLLKANLASAAVMKGLDLLVSGISKFSSALPSAISSLAEYGDNIDKMSQKMGMTAEAYQEWDAVMQHSGTSMESLKAGMKTLATAAEKGNDAFAALGITQEQIANMSQEELFNATIAALQGVTDETQRTYLAGQLLGRGATELGPLLNMSAEETQAMKDRLHELGGVMSDESVKAAARYQDSLQDLQTAIGGAKRTLVEGFLPAVSDVMDGLTNVISGSDVEGGIVQIEAGVNAFIDRLGEIIPRIAEIAARIIPAFAKALVAAIPKLANAAMEAISKLGDFILNAATGEGSGELAQKIGHVVLAIGEFIVRAIPVLAEAALKIIAAIAMFLISSLAELVKAGGEIVKSIAQGIGEKIGDIVNRVKEIGTKIKETIMGVVNKAKEWGWDLVANFIKGITGKLGELWDTIKGIGSGIKNFLGFSEPKMGPLSDFHTYAPDMMKLFAQGIRDNEKVVTDQIARSFDFGREQFAAPGVTAAQGGGANADQVLALLAEYLPIIASKRLTVDGSSLARSLAPAIDEQLGVIQNRKGRESYAAGWG